MSLRNMLLYWAMFTLGFWAGAILAFRIFAAKKPEEEEKQPTTFVLINKMNTRQQLEKETPQLPITPPNPQAVKES